MESKAFFQSMATTKLSPFLGREQGFARAERYSMRLDVASDILAVVIYAFCSLPKSEGKIFARRFPISFVYTL